MFILNIFIFLNSNFKEILIEAGADEAKQCKKAVPDGFHPEGHICVLTTVVIYEEK